MSTETLWLIFVDNAVKATLLLAAAWLLASQLLRRTSAARRHLAWTAALGAILVLPLFSLLLPQWRVLPAWAPAGEGFTAPPAPELSAVSPAVSPVEAKDIAAEERPLIQAPQAITSPHDWRQMVMGVWVAGVVLCLVRVAAGHVALWRLARQQKSAAHLASCEAPVWLSPRCGMPIACGILGQRIILPADAEHWPAARLSAVLEHELAHLRRRDCLWQTLGQLARALYWFNPLAWLAHRQQRGESEKACDDAVLLRGSKASSYAEDLLSFATTGRSDALLSAAAIAMARPGILEGRLLAILDSARNRKGVSLSIVAASLLLLLAVAAPLAMVHAQTTTPAYVRIVYDSGDTVLVDGKPAQWSEIPALLEKVPNRESLYLAMANVSDQIPVAQYRQIQARLSELVTKYHLKYLSDAGSASADEIAALTKAVASANTRDGSHGISLTLTPDRSLNHVAVFQLLEDAQPQLAWKAAAELQGKISYHAVIVAPIDGPDLQAVPSRKLWSLLNEPPQWVWGVMGLPATISSAQYGQKWPQQLQIRDWHKADSLKTGYYMLTVMAYAGEFRPQEGREPLGVAWAVLRVGQPGEPAKADPSKLALQGMKPELTAPDEVSEVVRNAVETISTCAETDPRVKPALASIRHLPSAKVASELLPYLRGQTNTLRRAALYILFRGQLDDITPAVEQTLALCKHEEQYTRGMAALALGQNRIARAYKPLAEMAGETDPFCRRCAVYALGLLGNTEALPLLKKLSVEDPEKTVRDNAQAAITMLGNPATTRPTSPPAATTKPAGETGARP